MQRSDQGHTSRDTGDKGAMVSDQERQLSREESGIRYMFYLFSFSPLPGQLQVVSTIYLVTVDLCDLDS